VAGCLAVAVSREIVDDFIEKQLERGYKPATVNRWVQLLSQSCNLAVKNGHLASSPRFRRLSETDNVRTGFFSPEEFTRVESHLPEYLRDFCRFGFVTSCRKSEIASLQWSDVDGNQIRLRAANAKNGTGRSVIMTGELADLIERRRMLRQFEIKSGIPTFAAYVFHFNGEPIASFRKAWWSACVAADVGAFVCALCEQSGTARFCPECKVETRYAGKLFHDLRRSAVRNMVRSGVSSQCGHEDFRPQNPVDVQTVRHHQRGRSPRRDGTHTGLHRRAQNRTATNADSAGHRRHELNTSVKPAQSTHIRRKKPEPPVPAPG
jgi:integrase